MHINCLFSNGFILNACSYIYINLFILESKWWWWSFPINKSTKDRDKILCLLRKKPDDESIFSIKKFLIDDAYLQCFIYARKSKFDGWERATQGMER